MLCQLCHANEASVYLIETVNNQHTTLHICEGCAQKKHLGEMLAKPAMAIHELLASILQLGAAPAAEEKELTCSRCGMTFSQFKQIGRFGCPECYNAFRDNLLPLFRQFHQAEEHSGRRQAALPPSAPTAAELKEQLRLAVQEERFEAAAKLRDALRLLEGTEKK